MKIYDSVPSQEQIAGRAKRDGFNVSDLVEVVAKRGHYAIRALGLPCVDHEYLIVDGKPQNVTVPAYIVYSLRRDGKVSNQWGFPVKAKDMLEINGVPQ